MVTAGSRKVRKENSAKGRKEIGRWDGRDLDLTTFKKLSNLVYRDGYGAAQLLSDDIILQKQIFVLE